MDSSSLYGPPIEPRREVQRDRSDGKVLSRLHRLMLSRKPKAKLATPTNAIESCMDGFDNRGELWHNSWIRGDKAARTHTLEILIHSVASLAGTDWAPTICKAAHCFPVDLLELMVYKGASASAMVDDCRALSLAASRDLGAMSAVEALLRSSSIYNPREADLQRALKAALAMFQETCDVPGNLR